MRYTCPVCGLRSLYEHAYDKNENPSFEICSCCGTEFGYDDFTKSHSVLRKEWMEKGCPWFNESKKPKDWNLENQLANIRLTLDEKYKND